MSPLIDTLFTKRFCLPSDILMEDLQSKPSSYLSSCVCGNFNHASCIFEGKDR